MPRQSSKETIRQYNGKIYKIISCTGEYFIGFCYQVSLKTHLKILLQNYLSWKLDLKGRNKYCVLFGFFENFGIDCKIELLIDYRNTIQKMRGIVKYLVDGLKDYNNCYNNHNNIIKKYRCYYLDI